MQRAWTIDYLPDCKEQCIDEKQYGRCQRRAVLRFTAGDVASYHCQDPLVQMMRSVIEERAVREDGRRSFGLRYPWEPQREGVISFTETMEE